MRRPLISHPTRDGETETYTADQLTARGDLRLDAHNDVVAERAVRLFGGSDRPGASFLDAAAALHDFGKATPQFQAYVRDEPTEHSDEETAHARLGALATWYVLGALDAPDRDRLAGTLAVARHHQALPDAAQYTAEPLARAFERGDSAIRAQLDAIDDRWPAAAVALLERAGVADADWAAFHAWATSGDAADELRELSAETILASHEPTPARLPDRLYDRTLRYWSAITLADKSHAMDVPESRVFDPETLDRDAIEDYVTGLRDEPPANDLEARLNDERERARRQATRGVHEWIDAPADAPPIATLTLPTGLGKTLTGLSAAFEARDRPASDDGAPRTVVYALPYTSIIEQTRALFEDPDLWDADPGTSALTVHHYLSETVVYDDENDDGDATDTDARETAAFLGEAWRDGTILTTFVQLFESLAGPTNRQGLKLSALRDGLVILDEPQTLPKDWWDGIERLLDVLTEEYGARVLAMTATQPGLVRDLDTLSLLAAGRRHDPGACEHCGRTRSYETALQPAPRDSYFEVADRVAYTVDPTALSRRSGVPESHVGYETAADRILDATDADGSTLAVCNTIGSSRELTDTLRDRSGVTHLGTHLASVLDDFDVDAVDPRRSDAADDDADAPAVDPNRPIESIADAVMERFRANVTDTETAGTGTADDDSRVALLTLNSRYRPFDREILIELADRLSTGDVPFALVSTQAIEAGVDLSFRTVFRDLAPLDSIVQAAGRCNRSYEWGTEGGRVVVWLLAAVDEETPATPSNKPPAYYVYERGATDAGIPGHLQLVSEVLADVPTYEDATEAAVSRDAVTAYFAALAEKSLSNGELRDAIDDARGKWLGRQSLIGGVSSLDVLVAVSDADADELTGISEGLRYGEREGYDRLAAAATLRVSLPERIVEEATQLTRVDRKARNSDGVQVFTYDGGGGLDYDLAGGGLTRPDDPIGDRFTH